MNEGKTAIPKLDEHTIRKYNEIRNKFDGKIPFGFEQFINYPSLEICKLFGISEKDVSTFLKVIEIKNIVNDFEDTVALFAMEPELIDNSIDDTDRKISNLLDDFQSEIDEYDSKVSDSTNINYIIFPNCSGCSFDKIRNDLYLKNSGGGFNSEKKVKTALVMLQKCSYSSNEFSPKVHKLKNEYQDVRLTNHEILMERYSSKKTKVSFCKLPLSSRVRDELKGALNNPYFENIYFVTGFGTIVDSGYSEELLYKLFLKNSFNCIDAMQFFANLASGQIEGACDILFKYINCGLTKIESLGNSYEKRK